MAGIVSYGAYVPFHRIRRAAIGEALGIRAGKGERAVASYDEDTVTMAVEAARNCLHEIDDSAVGALYFATTDPPYQEKLNASTIHAALALPRSVRALDLACSVRAGLGALMTAHDAALGGSPALATMADVQVGAPESAREQGGGDAAAAFLLGREGVVAEIEALHSESLEYLATWRLPGERFTRSWEERFTLTQAYVPLLTSAAKGLLARAKVEGAAIKAFVLDTPNPRAAMAVVQALKLTPQQVVGDLRDELGHCGAAHAGVLLTAALDEATPGDRIAVLSVSDGVDGILLRATDAIASHRPRRTLKELIASKDDELAYTRFLRWRGILEAEAPRRPDPERPAAPPSLREEHWKFAFMASQCAACGTYQLPPQIVCVKCGAVDQMREERFVDRKATIRTFTVDRLAFTPQPPMVVAIVDFEGGGRFQSELTDCEPDKVKIGDGVEMTFRRLFTAQGVHNYFWKARPAR